MSSSCSKVSTLDTMVTSDVPTEDSSFVVSTLLTVLSEFLDLLLFFLGFEYGTLRLLKLIPKLLFSEFTESSSSSKLGFCKFFMESQPKTSGD